eukprot:Gb_08051 [translate_table: standard]
MRLLVKRITIANATIKKFPRGMKSCCAIHEDAITLSRQGILEAPLGVSHLTNNSFDSETYASVLQACGQTKALVKGKQLHTLLIITGLSQDDFLGTKLVGMYSMCGNLLDARQVFDKMLQPNVFLWNAMIRGYARNQRNEEALTLYNQMQKEGIKPDTFTFSCVLKACASLSDLRQGREIHDCIIGSEFESDIYVGNAIVAMYAKCRSMENALLVFEKMPQRDVVSWNAIIGGYVQYGNADESLKFFYRMQLTDVKPDSVTIVSVLPACAHIGVLHYGKEIHDYIIKRGLQSDASVGNALVSMYAKCGSVEDARLIFDKLSRTDSVSWNAMITGYGQNGRCDEALQLFNQMILTSIKPDVITWCAIITAYVQNGHPDKALKFYSQMQLVGVKPDSVTIASVLPACAQLESLKQCKEIHDDARRYGLESDTLVANALVAMYAKCGSIECSREVFDKMCKRDVISWSAMIAGYSQHGHGEQALKLFRQMCFVGVKPNSITVTSVLSACAHLSALRQGKEIHHYIFRNGFESHVFVGSALIDMYAKCGSIEIARAVFDKMSERNVVSWNAMIAGYSMHGYGEDALTLFYQMEQADVMPDQITFIAILSACSHAGLVDEGWCYFHRMSQEYHLTPKVGHYACMVDLLGRAGHLDNAQDFIYKMPLKPNADVWGALLGACRIHCNIELGKSVAEHLFELQPENSGFYVLLSNIYSAAGRWDDVEKVRTMMKSRGLKKRPGCSWIEVKNMIHVFTAGDRSQPYSKEIYTMLDNLSAEVKMGRCMRKN